MLSNKNRQGADHDRLPIDCLVNILSRDDSNPFACLYVNKCPLHVPILLSKYSSIHPSIGSSPTTTSMSDARSCDSYTRHASYPIELPASEPEQPCSYSDQYSCYCKSSCKKELYSLCTKAAASYAIYSPARPSPVPSFPKRETTILLLLVHVSLLAFTTLRENLSHSLSLLESFDDFWNLHI